MGKHAKGGAQRRAWEEAGADGEAPKAKRLRPLRPKAKKAGHMSALRCDGLRLIEAAIRQHAPGLVAIEMMANQRSGFAKFSADDQAVAAIAKGSFHVAKEPVQLQRARGGDVFVAVNAKRVLFGLMQAEFPGLERLEWNPGMTFALTTFKTVADEQKAIQRGAFVLLGQAVQVSNELYDATLPDLHAREIVFALLQSQFPGLQAVTWSEDGTAADVRFRSDAEMKA
eukprot:EG_transcript_26679